MINVKEMIEEFEREYIWAPLRHGILAVGCLTGDTFHFTEKGFYLYDVAQTEYTLNEMSEEQLNHLARHLIEFQILVNQFMEDK